MDSKYTAPGRAPGGYEVQSTYIPPQPDEDFAYMPQSTSDSANPFTVDDNPFAGSAAGPQPNDVVPAVVPAVEHSTYTVPAASSGAIPFQDSQLPTHVTGKLGAPEVPQDNRRLLQGQVPSASPAGNEGEPGKKSFFNFKRFRKYFNVDTEDVLGRMKDSVIGSYKADFLEKIGDNADLYGPFWVATTLIFVSAVTGNYASYINYKKQDPTASTFMNGAWQYDVNKVGYSAILFYGYVGLIGLALFLLLNWWFKAPLSLPQVWCTYGYSMSIFIPVSFLCVFPYEALRWPLVVLATLSSGCFLVLNLKSIVMDHTGVRAWPMLLGMVVLHLGVGLTLKLVFFHY